MLAIYEIIRMTKHVNPDFVYYDFIFTVATMDFLRLNICLTCAPLNNRGRPCIVLIFSRYFLDHCRLFSSHSFIMRLLFVLRKTFRHFRLFYYSFTNLYFNSANNLSKYILGLFICKKTRRHISARFLCRKLSYLQL